MRLEIAVRILATFPAAAWLLLCSCHTSEKSKFTAPESTFRAETVQVGDNATSALLIAHVAPTFFGTPQAQPYVGRIFSTEEYTNHSLVALLNHAYWSTRFKADPGVIGTKLRMNGQDYIIVGVMPPAVETPKGVAAWVPGL